MIEDVWLMLIEVYRGSKITAASHNTVNGLFQLRSIMNVSKTGK